MQQSEKMIVSILRHEVDEKRARLAEIEGSAPWRIGGIITNFLVAPLRNGPRSIGSLVRLFKQARKRQISRERTVSAARCLSAEAPTANTLVYGHTNPPEFSAISTWLTNEPLRLLNRLEQSGGGGTLVLRQIDLMVVRTLARHQLRGWHLIWWPESPEMDSKHLVNYVAGLADEVRGATDS